MKLEHYFLYRDVDVDIKKVDKIEITDVDCYEGPNDTLIITKNNYPKFDELLSILEKYNGKSGGTGYIDIGFSDCSLYKEASNAIDKAKEWFKQKQKL